MTIGLMQLRLSLPGHRSLKEKRRVLLGLKMRLRQRFNVSVAEVGDHEKWQLATLAVACVGVDRVGVNRCLDQVAEFARCQRDAAVLDIEMEFL
jgi:hypothetical protein